MLVRAPFAKWRAAIAIDAHYSLNKRGYQPKCTSSGALCCLYVKEVGEVGLGPIVER
ncbi:hypothetical protein [Bartonella senegalensis]|uniref:hypothetical protein n=1 Tax=Bartonella senegalensis TaxID=1468418 RepID=UPI0002DE840A|nr:hypothetical protein [Bartonella senegalensis]